MRTTLLSLAVASGLAANAQINEQWDLCPNWTATDINGVQHTLYDYLDDGYTVILDMSATWCPPCWDIHDDLVLDSLYNMYGPGTADEKVMVFLFEVDATTTLADLNGTGPNTQGDWVTGTPYPIIDDASISQQLSISGFPRVYVICPNRMISAGYSPSVAQMLTHVDNCNTTYKADTPNDATLLHINDQLPCTGDPFPVNIRLQNTGTAPLTNAAIQTSIHFHQAQPINLVPIDTLFWTGNLGTYETVDLVATYADLPMGLHTGVVALLDVDDDAVNNEIWMGPIANTVIHSTQVTMEVLTDSNGAELSWFLIDYWGSWIDGASAGSYANNTVYTHSFSLSDLSCYNLMLSDGGGNGLSDPGYVSLSVNGTVFAQLDDFNQNNDILQFATDVAAAVPTLGGQPTIAIYPNPVSAVLTIEGTDPLEATVLNIVDATGRIARTVQERSARFVIDVEDLIPGAYVVSIRTGDRTHHQRLIVSE